MVVLREVLTMRWLLFVPMIALLIPAAAYGAATLVDTARSRRVGRAAAMLGLSG